MGTVLEITLEGPGPEAGRETLEALFDLGSRLEAVLTTFDPASPTSRLNAAAGRGPQAVPPQLEDLLALCIGFTHLTGGVFDVTVGPLVSLWRDAGRTDRLPTAGAIASARSRVGADRIVLPGDGTAALAEGMAVDFGGIAKGYALDRMRDLLRSRAVERALLSFGGSSVLALGAPRGHPGWRVLLQDGRGDHAGVVTLRDLSLAVSGSLGQTTEIQGRRFGHVIDPRDGQPLTRLSQAVVVAENGALAEALSKALLVLDAGPAFGLIESLGGTEALRIDETGAMRTSPGFGEATRFAPVRGAGAPR